MLLQLVLLPLVSGGPQADKVVDLPGLTFQPDFDHYSGYLTASNAKRFHYWLTESSANPTKDPLVLWLNGGPGCSSLDGLIEELGPFKVENYGNSITYNPWSWNKFANVLFIESPAGVGYSYSTDGNITTEDDEVSLNNYNALLDFLTKFPEYQGREFYITGESYAGVYLPTLGVRILEDKKNFPKFKGMAIGNGALNFPNNYNTMVPLYYYHGLVRDSLYQQIVGECCQGNIEKCDVFGQFGVPKCRQLIVQLLGATDNLNSYNIYDACYIGDDSGRKYSHILKAFRKIAGLPKREVLDTGLPLCAQTNNTNIYLNKGTVRRALHIPSSLPAWTECSDDVTNKYKVTHYDVVSEFEQLSAGKVRILVYNGDVDTVCNSVMNQQFLSSLNKTIIGETVANQPWTCANDLVVNVAGFQIKYSGNIDFVTVRGSGHFVPKDKPIESQQMIYNFIKNRDYSTPIGR